MALEDLTPVTRTESILDGDDISPVTRMEYFLGKAANEVPKPEGVSDAGKVLTVNAAGDGFELDTPESELPAYTGSDLGKVLTVGEGSGGTAEPKWEANSGFFIVTIGGTPQAPTADKTYSEITAAVNSGKIPIAVANGGAMILSYNGQTGTKYGFSLTSGVISGSVLTSISFFLITIANDDTVEMIYGDHGFQ